MVFYADDSAVARKQIERTLDAMASATLAPSMAARLGKSCNAWPPRPKWPIVRSTKCCIWC